MNKAILTGRITKDPILKKTQSGASFVRFTIAVKRLYPSQDQDADFISCIAWNKTAEVLCKYTHKGDRIGVSGQIHTRNYDDKDGRRVTFNEVLVDLLEFIESKKREQTNENDDTEVSAVRSDLSDMPTDMAYDDQPF